MDALRREVVERMPLAEAALVVWRFVFDEERLQALWERHRGRCYEQMISFPTMTHLVGEALLQYNGSGRRSFEKNIESGRLETSFQAAFGKLGRLPLPLSEGLLREGTAALRELFPSRGVRSLPRSLQEFDVEIVDGKALKNVAKRLRPLRGVGGGMLGGKALVLLNWSTGLATVMQAHPDGDASERPLVKPLLQQAAADATKPRLFVADRNFCDLVQTTEFTARQGDHFLVRHHAGTTFTRDPKRPVKTGKDKRGRTYQEEWGWLGGEQHKLRRYVRRIRLRRATQDGGDLVLITDLLETRKYPATDLLWLYQQRWGIERLFQRVTEVFGLERLIGGRPQACLFQFAFCLLLSNLVQLLTSYVARPGQREVQEISPEKLFDDVHRQLVAWNVMFTPAQTLRRFARPLTAAAVRQRLRQLLRNVWSDTWIKSPPQPHRRPAPPRPPTRSHASVHRLLQTPTAPTPRKPQRC